LAEAEASQGKEAEKNVFELLNPQLRVTLKKRFDQPTLPQKLAIPPILAGKNALVISETGSGKTESVALPIFSMILDKNPKPIAALYVTPLKALNRDLLDRLMWWANELGLELSVRHGDTTQHERSMQREFPPHMLIVTLETLQPLLTAKTMREKLRNVRYVILDEVHEAIESKRGIQLSLGLERLRKLCGEFQLIMLSATVGSPDKVAAFFAGGRDVQLIRAETAKQFDIRVISPEPQAGDEEIANALYTTEETAARLRAIMEMIKSARSSLTFTNTREFAEILVSRIRTLDKHFPVGIHHSSLSKTVRIDTEKKFKAEEIKSIVATSSLQLGIDIGSIDLVLQYMSPRRVSQLAQRVGRAGHGMDRVSRGIVIATDEDDCFEASVIARRALAGELEPTRFHTNALDVLAHQIVGMTLEDWKIKVADAYATVRRAWPYHTLTMQDFLSVARQLKILGLVFYDETAPAAEQMVEKKKRGFEYYFSQLSTIPTTKSYRVFNTLEQTFVGTLDEEFMALHGEPGTTFIVKGEPWRILEVEEDRVLVEPANNLDAAIPGWDGELMPVDFGVAQEVGALRRRIAELIAKDGRSVKDDVKRLYPVDDGVAEKMIKVIRQQMKSEAGVVPDEHNVLVEDFENLIVIHSCFGSVVNDTIGRFLAALLTTRVGSVGFKSDPYRIMVQFQTKEGAKNAELVREILMKTNPEHLQDYLELSLTKSEMFEWRFVHVAKRFGAFSRDVQFGRTRLKNIIAEYAGTPLYKETLREIETEKLDVAKAIEVMREMQSEKIKLLFHTGRGISPLGRIGVKHKYAEIIGPEKPTKELMALFNRRIMGTKERLVCVNCGEWSQTYTIKDMPADVKCPKCSAKLLAIVHPMDTQTQKSVLKKVKGRELSTTDADLVERARKSSDMYITYGRNAVIIMAGRGIGPATAKRILSRYHVKVEDLLKDMREAEVQFTKTKKFWKT